MNIDQARETQRMLDEAYAPAIDVNEDNSEAAWKEWDSAWQQLHDDEQEKHK